MRTVGKIKLALMLPLNAFRRIRYKTPNVLSDTETLDYIVEHGCAVVRFGDGELDLMCGVDIRFQRADKRLKSRLIEIAKSADERVLVCAPAIFGTAAQNRQKFTPSAAAWWNKHLRFTRGHWAKFFSDREIIGDTEVSRFYVDVADKSRTAEYVQKLKSVWDGRDVVFVEGKNSRLGVGNDLFDNVRSVRRIICPAENAFDIYDEVLEKTVELTSESDLIICALGPTATVLAYDLAKRDRQGLDLGHVDLEYEWYRMGATEKVGVAGKEAYEATGEIEHSDENADGVIYAFD